MAKVNNAAKAALGKIGSIDAPSASFANTKSLVFDGSDDHVLLDSATLSGPGSFQFWFNTAAEANQILISITAYHYLFLVGGKKVRCTWPTGWGASYSDMTWTISPSEQQFDGEWHHIVMTNERDGGIGGTSTTKIYWDGDLKATKTGTGIISGAPFVETDVQSYIGGQSNGWNDFNGNIDEVAFWGNTVLDADAVTILYNSGVPIALDSDSGNYDNSANLTHWWRMGDGDTYPTITDNEGSINGTMTNMTSGDIVSSVAS